MLHKLQLFLFFAFTLAACNPYLAQPLYTKPADNNDTYKVQFLFEHEGCKVYRFSDAGNLVYFTNCNGETIRFDSTAVLRNTTKKE